MATGFRWEIPPTGEWDESIEWWEMRLLGGIFRVMEQAATEVQSYMRGTFDWNETDDDASLRAVNYLRAEPSHDRLNQMMKVNVFYDESASDRGFRVFGSHEGGIEYIDTVDSGTLISKVYFETEIDYNIGIIDKTLDRYGPEIMRRVQGVVGHGTVIASHARSHGFIRRNVRRRR